MIFSKQKRILMSFVFGLLGLIIISGCSHLDQDQQSPYNISVPPSETILRIGVTPDSPPLISERNGSITGLEADFAKGLAKKLNKEAKFVKLDWNDLIDALLDNKIDIIMSGMTRTKLRNYRIAFSNSYFRTGQMALIRQNAPVVPNSFYILKGVAPTVKFGVIKGTTGEIFVKSNFGDAKEILKYASPQDALQALKTKQIDIFIYDAPVIFWLAAANESGGVRPMTMLLTEEYLAWGIRKDDTELLNQANDYLKQLKSDGSLDKLIKKWIPLE